MIAGLLVLLPFLAAGACLALGSRRRTAVSGVAIGTSAAVVVLAFVQALRAGEVRDTEVAGILTGGPTAAVSFSVDSTAAVIALMVAVVALLVQIYSTAYLVSRPDIPLAPGRRYPSYAALVSLFTAAMLLVVLTGDLLVLFAGWEVMGICSYFLIAHEWEEAPARAGAVKAFLVTRLGDVGLLFGAFVLASAAGTFDIGDILAAVPDMSTTTVTVAALLVLCGAIGKSAQFPLHTWLPDAMPGPTPVSALIHAATMVVAGVYLLARLYPVFLAAPAALAVLGVLAAITMLGAALAAFAQDDLKRVLAYSTVSQLAYMIAALAVGGREPALFHLLSHAGYKALLFLAAGAIIHAAGTGRLPDLGGLWRRMPITSITMVLALAALAGVPPMAGFFSKDAVLGAAEDLAFGHSDATYAWVGVLVLVVGLLTVFVTAAYATRLALLLFAREPRTDEVANAHDPAPAMLVPLVVLAVPTALFGFLGLFGGALPSWLAVGDGEQSLSPHSLSPHWVTALVSTLIVVIGVGLVLRSWRAPRTEGEHRDPASVLGRARGALLTGFGVDAAYDRAVVRPVRSAAGWALRADRDVLDAYVHGAGHGSRFLGTALRVIHTGNAQTYLTALVAGTLVLVVWVAS